jgi:Co/Zn/Cd efflux system component
MALLADARHNFGDAVGLMLAWPSSLRDSVYAAAIPRTITT